MSLGAKIWRVTWHVLVMLGTLVALFFVIVVPWFLTHIFTTRGFHFPDPNDGKTPKSYGLDFRAVEFRSTDGILLRGWDVPPAGEARGTIIYCHGHNRTRVEMLPRAVFAHSLGYDGLLFDFRHQGQSEGALSTVGYNERHDVTGAVEYALRELREPHPVIVWGVSLGAAAGLMAAAESRDIDAVISDSTFLSFEDTAIHHWKMFFHLPAFPVAYEAIYWIGWRGNFVPSAFDLRKAVEGINPRPVLFVAVAGDRRMPPSIAQTLYALSTSPEKALVVVPGNRHGEGFRSGTAQYEKAVTEFLGRIQGPNRKISATK